MKIVHRGFLYEAWTIADIKTKYEAAIVSYLEKYALKPEEPVKLAQMVDSFLNHINAADPSHDKKYLGAITKWALSKRPEDLDTQIKPYLLRFYKLLTKNPGKLGNISKNIAKGKLDLDGFKATVNKLEEEDASGALDHGTVDSRIRDKVGSFPKIGENAKYVCFKVDAWESKESDDYGAKHFCFSGKVDWCVKYKTHFDEYEPPYYYFLSKEDGSEYALLHVESDQLKDVSDNALTLEQYMPIKDIVMKIIGMDVSKLEGDLNVVLEAMTSDEFKLRVGQSFAGDILEKCMAEGNFKVVNKIFEAYPRLTGKLEYSTRYVMNQFGHLQLQLTEHSVKCLVDNYSFDEVELAYFLFLDIKDDLVGKANRLKFLIDHCGLNVNQTLFVPMKPNIYMLQYSIEHSEFEIFKVLMSYDNINVNEVSGSGNTALYELISEAEYGAGANEQFLDMLLDKGVNVNLQDAYDHTPLFYLDSKIKNDPLNDNLYSIKDKLVAHGAKSI